MWVTRRTDYATRAVLALAMAEDAMNLDQLAEATESPRSVLEQVMPSLRAAGIVRSVRGPGGAEKGRHCKRPLKKTPKTRQLRGVLQEQLEKPQVVATGASPGRQAIVKFHPVAPKSGFPGVPPPAFRLIHASEGPHRARRHGG